ncbi:MAG TPA: O-antigen ligase family protein [Phaeodactylibacter sp.]|nr:O-antigen ligase family protein [Phaeodactylibacter sp.]
MILQPKQHEAIHQYLLMLFCFLLPLHPRLSTLSLIFWGFNWLLSGQAFRGFKLLLKPIPILFIGFYILHLLGLAYTDNWLEGMQKIETKLPLLVFPFILFSFPIKKEEGFRAILNSFVVGTIVASLFCLGSALYQYFTTGENWMYYKRLGSFLGFHPTYFAMYLSLALFIVLFFLVKNYKMISQKEKIGKIILLSGFFLFVLLLSSRMTILATSAILGMAFLLWMYFYGKIWKGIGIGLIALMSLFFLVKKLPGLKKRTNATIERVEKQQKKQGVSDPRVHLWSAAWTVIQQSPIIGVGTGDAQNELVKIYKKRNYERELRENYNSHNQYLQTTVMLGIIGGLWFLVVLFLPFWMAFQQKDYLYLLFLALIILSFLAESVLETQRGTLFFGFFHSFFMMKIFYDE